MARTKESKKASKKSKRVDVEDLLDIKVEKGQVKEPERLYLVWTPARVAKAKSIPTFINTGWEQANGKKLTGSRSISKAEKYWSEDDKTEKHSTDTIFIASVPLNSFVEFFPGNFKGESEDDLDLYINGPKANVVRNLKLFGILPKVLGEYPADYEGIQYKSLSKAIDAWLEKYAISADNYKTTKAKEFKALVAEEPSAARGEVDVLTQERLEDLISLHAELRKGHVDVLDVNGEKIGTYPKGLTKSVHNIFTDQVLKYIKALTDDEDAEDKDKNIVLITHLANSDQPKVSIKPMPKNVDIEEQKYGSTMKRPLNTNITLEYGEGKTLELPKGKVWTATAKAVPLLFAEMEAVTKGKLEMSYTFTGKADSVKNQVQELLNTAQREKSEKELAKLMEETEEVVPGAERDAFGKKKK